MSKENKKYWQTRSKFMANALNFVGYNYMKFNDDKGVAYSFEETEMFLQAVKELCHIKQKHYNK